MKFAQTRQTAMTKPTRIKKQARSPTPPLRNGDQLSVAEFEHRYEALPELKRADLINGVVYLDSYMPLFPHGQTLASLAGWLGNYRAHTPGVQGGLNPTLTLRVGVHQPQADACLRVRPDWGGQSGTRDGLIVGGVELTGEIAANSASLELHGKLAAYEQNGILEYIVWRVEDREIDWFHLKRGKFQRLARTKDGLYKSKVFPGLWLDPDAMIADNMIKVLEVVQKGVASPEHRRFVEKLRSQKK